MIPCNNAYTRWAVNIGSWTPTLTQLTQAVAAVQEEERIRLMKFHFIDDFLSSLVGRLLMRKYVSNCTGLDFHQVRFARDVRGKPYWVVPSDNNNFNGKALSFNASHQQDLVVLAGVCSKDCLYDANKKCDFGLGVDVVKLEYSGGRSLQEFFRIMRRKFSESEWRCIKHPHNNEADQLKAFMRHWCLKESYTKEIGVGITIDLEAVSFKIDTTKNVSDKPLTSTTLRHNNKLITDFYFEEHQLNPYYCASIAFRNCQPTPACFEFIDINDLLVNSPLAEDDEIVSYCRKALRKERKPRR